MLRISDKTHSQSGTAICRVDSDVILVDNKVRDDVTSQ